MWRHSSLQVPGSGIHALSWEGESLRVALAVDSYIYFANIRPDYRWGYFGGTLVCAYTQPDRNDSAVLFWNAVTDERSVKFFKQLISIRASAEICVITLHADDNSGQFVLVLCNTIGSPLDSKHIDFEPQYFVITPHHVIAANGSFVYVWQYRTLISRLTSVDVGAGSLRRKEGRERTFHIDDVAPQNVQGGSIQGRESTMDLIVSVGASQSLLLVARESGVMHRYALPHITLDQKYTLRCRPQVMLLNCDSTRAAIIDTNGVFSLFDLGSPDPVFFSLAGIPFQPRIQPMHLMRRSLCCFWFHESLCSCLSPLVLLSACGGQALRAKALGMSCNQRVRQGVHVLSARTYGTCAGQMTTQIYSCSWKRPECIFSAGLFRRRRCVLWSRILNPLPAQADLQPRSVPIYFLFCA